MAGEFLRHPVVAGAVAGAALAAFEWNLRVLAPGTSPKSRWTFGVLLLGLAPVFWRVGLTEPEHLQATTLALAALVLGLRALEREQGRDAAGFMGLAAVAALWWPPLSAWLVLPAVALLLELWRRRAWMWLLAGAVAAGAAAWGMVHDGPGLPHSPDWALANFFKNTFAEHGRAATYLLPNAAYLLYPIAHPFFCLTLPALFLLFKKTDVHLYAKRLLAWSLVVFLLFVGGLPQQNLGNLLPAYLVLLLLLFPAWDRFFAYGLYFFPRLAYALMGLTAVCQIVFGLI